MNDSLQHTYSHQLMWGSSDQGHLKSLEGCQIATSVTATEALSSAAALPWSTMGELTTLHRWKWDILLINVTPYIDTLSMSVHYNVNCQCRYIQWEHWPVSTWRPVGHQGQQADRGPRLAVSASDVAHHSDHYLQTSTSQWQDQESRTEQRLSSTWVDAHCVSSWLTHDTHLLTHTDQQSSTQLGWNVNTSTSQWHDQESRTEQRLSSTWVDAQCVSSWLTHDTHLLTHTYLYMCKTGDQRRKTY